MSQIIPDIRLMNPMRGGFFGGWTPLKGNARVEALMRIHEEWHRDGTPHINLDGTEDRCKRKQCDCFICTQ